MVAAVGGAHAPSRAGDDALVIANFSGQALLGKRYISCACASPLRRGTPQSEIELLKRWWMADQE